MWCQLAVSHILFLIVFMHVACFTNLLYVPLCMCVYICVCVAIRICNSYNIGMRDLADTYVQVQGPQAQGFGHTYLADPKCSSYVPLPALLKSVQTLRKLLS